MGHLATAAAALAALALLTACGGGGGDNGSDNDDDNGMQEDGPEPIEGLAFGEPLLDLENRHPEEVRAALSAASSSSPQFGSITQSGSSLGGTGGRASVVWDQDTEALTVTIDRAGVKTVVPRDIVVASDDAGSNPFRAKRKETFNGWNGLARAFVVYDPRVGVVPRDYSEGTTRVFVTVEYPESDPESSDPDPEWLAGGWWMRSNGGGVDLFGGINRNAFTSTEFGAFIDGSGFDSNAPPADSGTATYEGSAHGLAYSYGDGALADDRAYTWSKDMELRADFDSNTISGCIGCELTDPPLAELYTPRDPRFFLEEAPIRADGTFTAADVRMEWDRYPDAQSSGSWGGRFLQPDVLAPRQAAGTMGIEWTDERDDTGGHFLGYWYATHDERKHVAGETGVGPAEGG